MSQPEIGGLVRLVRFLAEASEYAYCDACGDRFPSDYHVERHKIMTCTGYEPLRRAA